MPLRAAHLPILRYLIRTADAAAGSLNSTVAATAARLVVATRITGIVAEIIAHIIAATFFAAIVTPVIEPAPACSAEPFIGSRPCFHPLDLLTYAILVLLVVASARDGPGNGIEGIGLCGGDQQQACHDQENS